MLDRYDDVSNPIHYDGNGEIQCKDALDSMLSAAPSWMSPSTIYWWGSALKYLWRWANKNRIKDINKAIKCLQYMRSHASADILMMQEGFDDEQ